MFDFDYSQEFKKQLTALLKRNKPLADALKKKMNEVISRDSESIDFYKNLNAPLNEYKRAHVGSFVLVFKVYRDKNLVRFSSFTHHDEAYKK